MRSLDTPDIWAFVRKIYGSEKVFVLSSVIVALLVRTIVISSSPTFLLGGDTPGYVAYTREIIQNGFLIPGTNTIHFPGSFWVYPPILPYFWSMLTIALGNHPMTPFLVIEVSGMIADSLVIIPLYLISRMIFGRGVAAVSSLLYTVYLPDLYALTWGGVPQLFATFLFAWVIYFTLKISRQDDRSNRNAIYLGLVLVLLTFTHDLTIFVMSFILLAILGFSFFLKKVRVSFLKPSKIHLASITSRLPISLLISLPALLLWYIPRYWWLIDAGAPYINSSLPQLFPQSSGTLQLMFQGLNGYLSPLGFAIFLLPLSFWGVYTAVRRYPERTSVLFMFTIFPVIISVVDFHDPIIVARMGYYTFLPGLVFTAYGIVRIREILSRDSHRNPVGTSVHGSNRGRKVAIALVIPLILVSALGVSQNMYSHTFYNSYLDGTPNQVIDYSTLNWIHTNLPSNSTFASFGEFGYYIMGYDGNPTLVYQNLKYLTQPAEWNESIAAYNLVYQPAQNLSLTKLLIQKYNVSYVTGISGVDVPNFYRVVYSDNSTTIYYVQ